MRKLTKGEKRNLINQIRHHEKMIDKIEKELYKDDMKSVLLVGTKTIDELVKAEVNNVNTIKKLTEFKNGFKVSIEHVKCGRDVICTIRLDSKNIEVVGVAKCANDDRFDTGVGMTIAEYRATAKFYEELAKYFGNMA